MRIAYLGQMADAATENGISKKIRAQGSHWRRAGHAVRYFSLVPTTAVWAGLGELDPVLLARGHTAQRIARSYRLAGYIREWRPDVIYFRYAYHSAGFPALFRAIPTVAEVNSDDLAEYPTTLGRAKVLYHRLTRHRVLKAIAGFVTVTHELAPRFATFGRPTRVIANGIDLDDFAGVHRAAPSVPLRLVFVGSAGAPWHGLERVVELARLFPESRFDIVGCAAAEAPGAPGNMRFHGQLPRVAYEPLLASATAAIGTMALFRKNMEEACPLKVREYLAAGLPVLGAYRDTDIPDQADYFLRLPNDGASLAPHRQAIAAWLGHWHGRRVPRAAIAHLDYAVKEQHRLAFLAQIAA